MNREKKEFDFSVEPGLCLTLEDLWAEVTVVVGSEGVARVSVEGSEKFLKSFKATQESPTSLSLRGDKSSGNNISISCGNVFSSVSVRGCTQVVMGSNCGTISMSGGEITINGKKVTGDSVGEAEKMAVIKIYVPRGTDLDVDGVENFSSSGLGGKVNYRGSGQSEGDISDVNELKVRCDGQSNCRLRKVAGNAKLNVSGQSSIDVQGEFGDIEASASGQSEIDIHGNCHDIEAEASGQSEITLHGKASGKTKARESGQSDVRI